MSTITLLKRWIGIATGKNRVAVKQGEGRFYSKSEVLGYYNDLTGKINDQTLLDDNGIPVNIIEGGQKVYFPISIFQYALGLWDLYLETKDEDRKNHFLCLCQWIIEAQREDGSWNCFGPIGYKRLTVSSMGQGEAASVLLRAYRYTGEDKWLEAAKKAITFMLIDVEDGGTLLREGNDFILEEYANAYGDKKSVLNGWIFSLFGLYDYLKLVQDEHVREIYCKSLNSLKKNLKHYDNGYWSMYDRTGRLASPAYHDLHICLLNVLSDITEDNTFKMQARVFTQYQKSGVKKVRAIIKKIIQKLRDNPEGILVK